MAEGVLVSPKTACRSAWQQQIGRHRGQRFQQGPRPFAALVFRYGGRTRDGLVDLRRLRIDVLHDLPTYGVPITHRLARYTAGLVTDGIALGGASRIQFEKNLSYAPGRESRGRRIGVTDRKLLNAALEMDRYLERCSRFPNYPRRSSPRLPRCWVSLAVQHPKGGGEAFERFCRDTGWPEELALASTRHLFRGDWLYPLEYVGHHLDRVRAVYADLSSIPRRQVFRYEQPQDLVGFEGICRFDFWNCRFRQGPI